MTCTGFCVSRALAATIASRTDGERSPPTPYTVSVGKHTSRAAAMAPASSAASPAATSARSMRRPLTRVSGAAGGRDPGILPKALRLGD